jgi:adenylate cyclase
MNRQLTAAYLTADSGGDASRFDLADGVIWKIGRSEENQIVVIDETVSRLHAMIQRDGSRYLLIDLGSRNGSFVEERRVTVPVYLRDQARVGIGSRDFVFHNPPATIELPAPTKTPRPGLDTTKAMIAVREITVLVVDIRGYTHLAHQIDQPTLAKTIGRWIRQAGEILEQEESWGQKFIGDAVMAVWLHPESEPEIRKIARAFMALSRLVAMTSGLQAKFDLPVAVTIGAGINTDLSSLSNVGTATLADFTVLGDGVNLTFRLESASRNLKEDLLIGQTTYGHIQALAGALVEPYEVSLKGYDSPTQAYACGYDKLPEIIECLNRRP